jgi:hypothetical protein
MRCATVPGITGFFDPAVAKHPISIWCSQPSSLLCSVNDVVNVLPYATGAYLTGEPC